MAVTASPTPALSTATLERVVRFLLPVTVALTALEIPSILADRDSTAALYDRAVVVLPMDIPMLVAVAAGLLLLVRTGAITWKRLVSTYPAVVALGGILVFAFNPSLRGVATVTRFAAAGVLWLVLVRASREDRIRLAVIPLTVVASLEGLLAVAQLGTGEPLGLGKLEPVGTAVLHGATVPVGSYSHPYLMAGFAAVATALAIGAAGAGPGRRWWTLGASLAIVPVGLAHSRAILLGAVSMLVVFAVVGDRETRRTTVVVGVVLAISMVWAGNGWLTRVDDSTGGDVTTGRVEHARQAVDLMAGSPLVGTGPGQYVLELETIDHEVLSSVHNAPLFFGAELGVALGLVVTAAIALLAAGAVRSRSRATAEVVPFVLSLLVAITFFAHPIGVLVGGLVGGVIAGDTDDTL